jgi:hypothetical protein
MQEEKPRWGRVDAAELILEFFQTRRHDFDRTISTPNVRSAVMAAYKFFQNTVLFVSIKSSRRLD